MKRDWKDIGIRSAKTFVQSFGGAVIALLGSGSTDAFTQAALISALATAICAVWNTVINPALIEE